MATDIIARGMASEAERAANKYVAGTNINFIPQEDGTVKITASGDVSSEDDVARELINNHKIDMNNPHNVTAEQLGLGNVDNTSDISKPISKATQNALDGKSNTNHTHTTYDSHIENVEIHVTAEEKAAWNGKAELSDIPSTLPANGGNADTVDGKHANELVQCIGKITSITIANDPNYGTSYEGNLAPTIAVEIGLPSGWYHLKYLKHQDSGDIGWGLQIALPLTKSSFLPMYRFAANEETSWSMWHAFADGGNADTLDGLHANEIASNPNLLINPDFGINQRGLTTYSGTSAYSVDHWFRNSEATMNIAENGITLTYSGTSNPSVFQRIENTNRLSGKALTFSACIDGTVYSCTNTLPNIIPSSISNWAYSRLDGELSTPNNTVPHIRMQILSGNLLCILNNVSGCEWVKLEIGSTATPYSPPDPATELAKCQRYYQIRSTGDIAAVDMRPSMRTITDIKQRSDGNYEYIAEL